MQPVENEGQSARRRLGRVPGKSRDEQGGRSRDERPVERE